jgi:hypothetical protein
MKPERTSLINRILQAAKGVPTTVTPFRLPTAHLPSQQARGEEKQDPVVQSSSRQSTTRAAQIQDQINAILNAHRGTDLSVLLPREHGTDDSPTMSGKQKSASSDPDAVHTTSIRTSPISSDRQTLSLQHIDLIAARMVEMLKTQDVERQVNGAPGALHSSWPVSNAQRQSTSRTQRTRLARSDVPHSEVPPYEE